MIKRWLVCSVRVLQRTATLYQMGSAYAHENGDQWIAIVAELLLHLTTRSLAVPVYVIIVWRKNLTGICAKWRQRDGDDVGRVWDVVADRDLLNLNDRDRLSCTWAENIRLPPCNLQTKPPTTRRKQRSLTATVLSPAADACSKQWLWYHVKHG